MRVINALLNSVPGCVYAAIIAVLFGSLSLSIMLLSGAKLQYAKEKAAHEATKARYAESSRLAMQVARESEHQLAKAAEQIRKNKDEEIASLNRTVRDLRDRLSHLSNRPASDPNPPASFGTAPEGCPGPVLYRDTAQALADEAERADTIRINLIQCYAQYERAREVAESAGGESRP